MANRQSLSASPANPLHDSDAAPAIRIVYHKPSVSLHAIPAASVGRDAFSQFLGVPLGGHDGPPPKGVGDVLARIPLLRVRRG